MSNRPCKMYYVLDKNVKMPFIMVDNIPIFYENGKVYFIYKDFPIGTYYGPDHKSANGSDNNVFDNSGNVIGMVRWDEEDQGWTRGNLICLDRFKDNGYRLKKYGFYTGPLDFDFSKYGVANALGLNVYADTSWNEDVAWISSLGQKDRWGATAAYICYQNYNTLSKENKFYTAF